MRTRILLYALLFANCLFAQNNIKLNETIISANKKPQPLSDVSNHVDLIKEQQIKEAQVSTTADLLEKKGNVFIQRSQLGGGSPVIRGFEASRVLIVIDGVRMNNAIYRSGHLQNVISIDNNALQQVEVIHGPGSTIYGSDALGGVLSFYTQKPKLSTLETPELDLHAGAMVQYQSASDNRKANIYFNIGGKKLASYTNFTLSEFGSLRIGRNNSASNPNWGLNPFYTEFRNGNDTIIANDKPWVLKNTEFRQVDLLQKLLIKTGEGSELIANFQYSTTSDIPRTDRMNFIDSKGNFKDADWRYGPQTRLLASIQVNFNQNKKLYNKLSITGAFQKIYEERITRGFGSTKTTDRFENVSVGSLNIDARKNIGSRHALDYGFEFTYNEVFSKATRVDKITGIMDSNASTRYPENGSYVRSTSIYVKDDYRISDMWTFSAGLRANSYSLNAGYQQPSNSATFNSIEINNLNLSGNVALNFHPCNRYRLYTMISSAYRAPNIDDLAKFSPDKATQKVIVPNKDLKSETAYNWELGVFYSPTSKWEMDITPYFMLINNIMQINPMQVNGQDSILADGVMQKVYGLTNRVAGINTGINARLNYIANDNTTLYSSYTYTFGQNISDGTRLDHISPMFGVVGVDYTKAKFSLNFNVKWNGAKTLDFYGPVGSEDNIEYATINGTPAWWTVNAKAKYQFNKSFNLNLGIDNLFDLHYRPFSSTISAPGINFIVGIRGEF